MSSSLNRRHLDAGDQHAIVLALDWPRPILVAPNEKDRDFDAPIVLGRGLPALGISEQARESAVMPGAIPDKIHFFQKRRGNAVRIGNAAAKHRVHDE